MNQNENDTNLIYQELKNITEQLKQQNEHLDKIHSNTSFIVSFIVITIIFSVLLLIMSMSSGTNLLQDFMQML